MSLSCVCRVLLEHCIPNVSDITITRIMRDYLLEYFVEIFNLKISKFQRKHINVVITYATLIILSLLSLQRLNCPILCSLHIY